MSHRERILVVGATGAQGGSVARHLLEAGGFQVRCLTRDPSSAAARGLAWAGAEVVMGDLGNSDSVRAAVSGCTAVFGVTSFWEHFEEEARHGRNLVDEVARAGVRHLVFSTLGHPARVSGGELRVPHFDIKAGLQDYAVGMDVPATFVHVASYYENFLSYFVPRLQEDGTYEFGFPQGDTPLAGASVEDLGGVVLPLFRAPREYVGRTVHVVGDELTGDEYAAALRDALGLPIYYRHIPRPRYASLGFPGAAELADMFEYTRSWVPSRGPDLARCRTLYPPLRTFGAWARQNARRLFEAMHVAPSRPEPVAV